jgi:hypothetical protein
MLTPVGVRVHVLLQSLLSLFQHYCQCSRVDDVPILAISMIIASRCSVSCRGDASSAILGADSQHRYASGEAVRYDYPEKAPFRLPLCNAIQASLSLSLAEKGPFGHSPLKQTNTCSRRPPNLRQPAQITIAYVRAPTDLFAEQDAVFAKR